MPPCILTSAPWYMAWYPRSASSGTREPSIAARTICAGHPRPLCDSVLGATCLSGVAHGAATRVVRAGRGAVQTINDYAAAYWWALHALHRSPEWKDLQERWQPCADREGWAWSP